MPPCKLEACGEAHQRGVHQQGVLCVEQMEQSAPTLCSQILTQFFPHTSDPLIQFIMLLPVKVLLQGLHVIVHRATSFGSHNTYHNSAKKAITFSGIFFGCSGAFLERSYCFQQRKICALCTREYRKDAAVSGVPGKRLTVILSRQAVPQHQETHWRRRQGQRRVSAPADCG